MTRECSGNFTAGSRGAPNRSRQHRLRPTADVPNGAGGPPAAMTPHRATIRAVPAAAPRRSARRERDGLGSAGQLQGWSSDLTSIGNLLEIPFDPLEPPHAQTPLAVALMIARFESTINRRRPTTSLPLRMSRISRSSSGTCRAKGWRCCGIGVRWGQLTVHPPADAMVDGGSTRLMQPMRRGENIWRR